MNNPSSKLYQLLDALNIYEPPESSSGRNTGSRKMDKRIDSPSYIRIKEM